MGPRDTHSCSASALLGPPLEWSPRRLSLFLGRWGVGVGGRGPPTGHRGRAALGRTPGQAPAPPAGTSHMVDASLTARDGARWVGWRARTGLVARRCLSAMSGAAQPAPWRCPPCQPVAPGLSHPPVETRSHPRQDGPMAVRLGCGDAQLLLGDQETAVDVDLGGCSCQTPECGGGVLRNVPPDLAAAVTTADEVRLRLSTGHQRRIRHPRAGRRHDSAPGRSQGRRWMRLRQMKNAPATS